MSFSLILSERSLAVIKQKYEFDPQQNSVISGLAGRMTIVGIVLIIVGIPLVLTLIKGNIIATIVGATYIIMGLLIMNSSQSFREIVKTQNNDIENLMTALDALKNFYTIQLLVGVAAALALGYLYIFNA